MNELLIKVRIIEGVDKELYKELFDAPPQRRAEIVRRNALLGLRADTQHYQHTFSPANHQSVPVSEDNLSDEKLIEKDAENSSLFSL